MNLVSQKQLKSLDNGNTVNGEQAKEFPIWRTLTLGMHKTPKEYCQAFKKADCCISAWAYELLDKTGCARTPTEVDLVNVSVGDLGFSGGTSYRVLCGHARSCGLDLCPAEVGPALRLAYRDQPRGRWLRVGMQITFCGSYPVIFEVNFDAGRLWLEGCFADSRSFWDPDEQFVFARRR